MKHFFTILLSLLSLYLSAGIIQPVHWSVSEAQQTDSLLSFTLTADIDDGWHLYSTSLPPDGPKPTAFSVEGIGNLTVTPVKGNQITAYDENFLTEISYFSGEAAWQLQVPLSAVKGDSVLGCVEYMACDDNSCIPPTVWNFTVTIPSSQSSLAAPDSAHNLLWLFIMGLLGGFLAIFTPCVWPIIPMTVSFFMKRNDSRKAVKDAVLYGLSIIVIYVALGLLVTLIFGASALNDISTNAIVNLFFFALLVVFALSFFGAFEITLPASWSTRLDNKARSASGILSILLMAFTLVIVSFSCTGPIIGTLLVEAAGKALLAPAVGMLGFAIALALPFSLFAMFPRWMRRMPKSGGWMDSFKVVLAFLELALSLKFFSVADLAYGWHLLDREVFLSLWIVIFALLGFYLLGLFRFRHEEKPEGISVFRFLLAVISLSFAIYMVPGLWGAPLKSISAFAPPVSTQDWVVNNHTSQAAAPHTLSLNQTAGYEEALQQARQSGKPLLLDFSGYGCVNCRKMEAKVLSDESVQNALADYIVITLIVDDKTRLAEPVTVTENGRERLLKTVGDYNSYLQRSRFSANAQPYYVRLSPDGRQIGSAYSYNENITEFLKWLQQ